MKISFLKKILRYFRYAKLQSAVAATCLILGWSCFISISLFLYKQLTYDQFHKKYKQIYRVNYNEKIGEIAGNRLLGTVGPTVGPALKDAFPEVEAFVRFRYSPDWVVKHGSRQFYENSVWYADSSVFAVFDFQLKEGNSITALTSPNSVVVTQDIAKKYFGRESAVGKTLTMNNEEYRITGVLDDIPSNSHIRFDFLLPFQSFKVPFGYPTNLQDWGWISFYNYVLLKPNTDVKAMDARLTKLVKQHFSSRASSRFRFELQPLKDIYLGDAKDEKISEGNKTYLLVLGLSSVLVLLTACFNFANLFSAMSIAGAKEIGIRKMLGAGKNSLAWNINRSALLMAMTTLFISLILLPVWSKFVPWSVSISEFQTGERIAGLAILIFIGCIVGFLASLYPSVVLSAYDFQSLLKGSFSLSSKGVLLRKSMLVGQFVVSIALLSSVVIISKQLVYLKGIDTGFARDELMLVHMPGYEVPGKFESLYNILSKNPNVTGVSLGGGRLDGTNGDVPIYCENKAQTGEPMNIMSVSFNFFKTAGIKIVSGKEFTRENAYDTTRGVILNESAAKALGLSPEMATGKPITVGDILLHGEVMGVVKDFNFSSLHNRVAPLVMYYPKSRIEDIFVRYKGANLSRIVSSIEKDWNKIVPELPFDFQFMNDNLSVLYRTDQVFQKMFTFFSVVAIIIACLGLFGLLSQDVIYRLKEIAIRKVLGANISGISFLLLKKYLILFAISNIVAWPLSYYYMERWLNEFSYRESVQWFVFPLASIAFLVLSIVSVAYLIRRAANVNPVKSLKAK